MCEYQGDSDPTWVSSAEWDEEDYKKTLGQITGVSFTALTEPLQPFDVEENPTPEVSNHNPPRIVLKLYLHFRSLTFILVYLADIQEDSRLASSTRRGGAGRAEGAIR
jgi:hypothetical protein